MTREIVTEIEKSFTYNLVFCLRMQAHRFRGVFVKLTIIVADSAPVQLPPNLILLQFMT